jgi:uncharacterized protein (TIGR02466 family)
MSKDSRHQQLFYSFLDEEVLDLSLKTLEEWCYYVKDNDSGRYLSNIGGWQSRDLDIRIPEIIPLVSKIFEKSEKLILKYNLPKKFYINPIWININGKKDFNMYHEHPRSMMAGVFYIKCPPNCGELVLVNPVSSHQHYIDPLKLEKFNEFNAYSWSVEPVENKLIMFPSWVPHYTQPNLSAEDRISIAFNICCEA